MLGILFYLYNQIYLELLKEMPEVPSIDFATHSQWSEEHKIYAIKSSKKSINTIQNGSLISK
jgi:hypothetical protein